MTISVALNLRLGGPAAVTIEVADPVHWTEADARDYLYTLQRLAGGGGIVSQGLHEHAGGTVIEVVAVTGRVTTPPLALSGPAKQWLERVAFDLPMLSTSR